MRTVIVHETDGIFVGEAMGLAFFSMLDSAGQETAVTFADENEAREFVAGWSDPEMPGLSYMELDIESEYAEIADLVRAGLGGKLGDLLANATPAARC